MFTSSMLGAANVNRQFFAKHVIIITTVLMLLFIFTPTQNFKQTLQSYFLNHSMYVLCLICLLQYLQVAQVYSIG